MNTDTNNPFPIKEIQARIDYLKANPLGVKTYYQIAYLNEATNRVLIVTKPIEDLTASVQLMKWVGFTVTSINPFKEPTKRDLHSICFYNDRSTREQLKTRNPTWLRDYICKYT